MLVRRAEAVPLEIGAPESKVDPLVCDVNRLAAEGLAFAVPHFGAKKQPPHGAVIRSTPQDRKKAQQTKLEIARRKILGGEDDSSGNEDANT